MKVSYFQLGHKKLTQIIFEWKESDRASLLAFLILIEVVLQWAWCLLVWINSDKIDNYINLSLTNYLWAAATALVLFYSWLTLYLANIKKTTKNLSTLQWLLTLVYSVYISIVTLLMGYSTLVAGVSLMGGAMLAMLLINRRVVWYGFIAYICCILCFIVTPYFGVSLPSLQKPDLQAIHSSATKLPVFHPDPISTSIIHEYLVQIPSRYHDMEDVLVIGAVDRNSDDIAMNNAVVLPHGNILFWHLTYAYFAIPKAIIIVLLFRTLLSIIERNKREIQYNADHDVLTGIKNRRGILSWIHQSLFNERFRRDDDQDYSVILLDLDAFKKVNDTYGHQVGDLVLQDMAKLLNKALIRRHEMSRYGGEEFLLVLPETTHATALLIAEALRREIEYHQVYINDMAKVSITASFGVATLSQQEVVTLQREYHHILTRSNDKFEGFKASQMTQRLIQNLIDWADAALYEAKHEGRNTVISANRSSEGGKLIKPIFELMP